MAHIENIPVHGVLTPVWVFDSPADKIDVLGQWYSNRNLLLNSYWANKDSIINQRGQEEYTAGGYYTIDRYKLTKYGNATLKVEDGYIQISKVSDTDFISIRQPIENAADFAGKTVTFSALVRGTSTPYLLLFYNGSSTGHGTTNFAVDANKNTLIETTLEVPANTTAITVGIGLQQANAVGDIKAVAAKLELGSVQTLAHKDASGNWHLNDPPPDKALELAKCQRYQSPMSVNAKGIGRTSISDETAVTASFPIPVTLRAKPTLTNGAEIASNYRVYANGASYTPTAVSVNAIGASWVTLNFTVSAGIGVRQVVQVEYSASSADGLFDSNL